MKVRETPIGEVRPYPGNPRVNDGAVQAYRLADNKVGELATWDMGLLAGELDGICGIDMGEFGFEDFGYDSDALFSEQPRDEPRPADGGAEPAMVTCPECGHEFRP